jgi:hypothetical protein
MPGIGIPQFDAKAKVKGKADIVFCLDVTGSMQPCIDGVKNNIKAFITNLKTGMANQPVDWQASVVGYRDLQDPTSTAFEGFGNPFSNEEAILHAQLDALVANGGGDEPESLLDALHKIATEIAWPRELGGSHRIVIVFTDATCRPELDPSSSSADKTVNAVVSELTAGHIKLFLFGPDCPTYTELSYIPNSQVEIKGSNRQEVHQNLQNEGYAKVLEAIAKTVSQIVVSL